MDRYYQLLDANSVNVSSVWKVMHVTTMLFATISGFISAYTLGKAIDAFDNRCILFAHIVFLDNSTLLELPIALRELPDYFHGINMPETDWGQLTRCYFCQFTPVMSMISGLIWGAFFIVCSKGGAGYISDSIYRPWRIVYPAMVFALITVGLLLLSTLELSAGINTFCAQFKDIFNTTECTNYIDEYTLFFSDTQKPLVIFLRASLIASIICLICWIAQLITLILRVVCVADFEMFKISVTFPNDSEESIQGIIDPDNVSFQNDNMSSTSKISIASKKSNHKRILPKLSPSFFLKKFSKFKRSSSSSDQYYIDRDDVIFNEPSTSSKFDVDKTTILESKSAIPLDLISTSSNDKEAKHVDTERQHKRTSFEDTVYSSLFFGKREKNAKKVADAVIRESLSFVPHSSESILSDALYSKNQIKTHNSDSNQVQQNPLISSEQPNNDYLSIDYTNRYESFGFVVQPRPLRNDNSKIKVIEQKSDDNLKIVLKNDKTDNYFSKNNNLVNLAQKSNSLPIQFTNYEQSTYTPHGENVDEEIIAIIDRSSKENLVISRNRTAAVPNYEYISNSIPYGYVHFLPVDEEIIIPQTSNSLPILSYTENAPQKVGLTPSNETINSNNYIHNSNTILGLTRNKHRAGRSQTIPYTLQQNTEENEEIPPHEFHEEPRNETNTAEDPQNDIRDVLLKIYVVLWLAVVLRNIGSLI